MFALFLLKLQSSKVKIIFQIESKFNPILYPKIRTQTRSWKSRKNLSLQLLSQFLEFSVTLFAPQWPPELDSNESGGGPSGDNYLLRLSYMQGIMSSISSFEFFLIDM